MQIFFQVTRSTFSVKILQKIIHKKKIQKQSKIQVFK